MSKFQQAISGYKTLPEKSIITEQVNNILEQALPKNLNQQTYKTIFSALDLTSLNSTDTKESIWRLVQSVNEHDDNTPDIPNIAAICVYPNFVSPVKEALTADNVKIASVAAGFPSAQTFQEVKVAETALAINDGADEIDIVLNIGLFLDENLQEVYEEIREIKDICRSATLKVIVETGALKTTENIQKASILALYSGADFIKTSTGKEYPGASLEDTYIICQTLKAYFEKTNIRCGIKVSGGIRTLEDATKHYTIVKEVLGDEWLNSQYFRIGASKLASTLLSAISEQN